VEKLSKQGFEQVCIWPGTLVVNDSPFAKTPEDQSVLTPEERIASFENWMKEEFDTRVKYLEEVKTNPDLDKSGKPVPETGDRNDLFFLVHKDDIGKFAVPRLRAGIRWYEDVVSYNNHANLYPQEILEKYKVRW
jgi:hypothetical protein